MLMKSAWIWMILLAAAFTLQAVNAGFCVRPPIGALAFCSFINYRVYVINQEPTAEYWALQDRKAEIMTEDWSRLDGCDASITQANGWCKNYACALTFPKCNTGGDAPLGICRQTCLDCFDTCTPDRPVIAPSLFFGKEAATWEQAYTSTAYDAFTKSYRCEADHRLVDGVVRGLLYFGRECTSGSLRLQPCILRSWFALALLYLAILAIM